jgi:hypothetical protein
LPAYRQLLIISCNTGKYDTIIRNGMVYDGNGGAPFKADVAIKMIRSHLSVISQKNLQRMK